MDKAIPENPFLHVYRELESTLPRPRRVLDVGSGGGYYSVSIARALKADHLTMVDAQIKPTGASDTPWKGYKMNIREQKFVPRLKGKHNVITCSNAFHEFDRDLAIKRFMQIIPPGGFLIIQDTNHAGWLRRIDESAEYSEEDLDHLEQDLEKIKRNGMFLDEDIFSFWEGFGKKVPGFLKVVRLTYVYFVIYFHQWK